MPGAEDYVEPFEEVDLVEFSYDCFGSSEDRVKPFEDFVRPSGDLQILSAARLESLAVGILGG